MIHITQLLGWSLLLSAQRVACSHPGVTRVLPVEGGLTDFRVGPAPSSPHPPSTATPHPPASSPQPPSPATVREEVVAPESAVRFPNNLDFELGDSLVRGAPSYPASNNAQGYISRPTLHALHTGTEMTGAQVVEPGIDSVASASENAYREGEYLEDANTPSLIGGQTDSEVTFRYEHHPSIFIKNPTFNSVAIGFMVYLILLTLLQNSMVNWSQKGALLTLGATTQRYQREAINRVKPIAYRMSTTTPETQDVDNRARIQLESVTPKTAETTKDDRSHHHPPVSVKDILNSNPDVSSAATAAKSQTAGPTSTSLTDRDHSP